MRKTRRVPTPSLHGGGYLEGSRRYRPIPSGGIGDAPPLPPRQLKLRSPADAAPKTLACVLPVQSYAVGEWETAGAPLLATFPPPGDVRETYEAHLAREIANPSKRLYGL